MVFDHFLGCVPNCTNVYQCCLIRAVDSENDMIRMTSQLVAGNGTAQEWLDASPVTRDGVRLPRINSCMNAC